MLAQWGDQWCGHEVGAPAAHPTGQWQELVLAQPQWCKRSDTSVRRKRGAAPKRHEVLCDLH